MEQYLAMLAPKRHVSSKGKECHLPKWSVTLPLLTDELNNVNYTKIYAILASSKDRGLLTRYQMRAQSTN